METSKGTLNGESVEFAKNHSRTQNPEVSKPTDMYSENEDISSR